MLKLEKVKVEDPHIQKNFDKIQSYLNNNTTTFVPHKAHFKWDGTFKLPHQYNGLPSFFGITKEEGSGSLRVLQMTKDFVEVHVVLKDTNYIIEFVLGNIGKPHEVNFL